MILSSKLDYANHAMNYIAHEKCVRGCSMKDIYLGETIPWEYMESIMMELTHRGFLTNEDKINGRFRLARPWNDAAFIEMAKFIEDLWCWPLLTPLKRNKRGMAKTVNSD